MVHESIIQGYHVYKVVWKPKIGLGSTARAMHDQHAVNSASMRLTASIKPGKYVCAYEKVCAYKKGALNNQSLRYLVKVVTLTVSTHVANIANEWLPCTNLWENIWCHISTLKVKFKIPLELNS